MISINRIKNFENLDLFINDCYFSEFEKFTKISIIKNFQIMDFFILNEINKLLSLNIEFNSLDYLTFHKLLSIIKQNTNLKSLQISFFSSLIIYSPQYILKIYKQITKKKLFEENIFSLENYFLNELLPYFIENLKALFSLIKSKIKVLEILSLVFDIPEILFDKQRYLIIIFKFILDLFYSLNFIIFS